MTKSVRKGQKKLRRHSKPHSYYAQSPGYWRQEVRRRDKVKDENRDIR